MVWPLMMICGRGTTVVLPGFSGSGALLREMQSSAVLSSSKSALCSLLQSRMPPGFSIIALSFPFASLYVLPHHQENVILLFLVLFTNSATMYTIWI